MRVGGKSYRTVWMEGSVVHMIDQNLLPFDFSVHRAKTYEDTCEAIREMRVRGAGAIGAAAGFAMAQAFAGQAAHISIDELQKAKKHIESTRPTARNLFYATERVFSEAVDASNPVETAFATARQIADEDAAACRRIGQNGKGLIERHAGVLTHCNAGWLAFVDYGSALSPVYAAREAGMDPFVYVDETRPRCQGGRLTAWELHNEQVSHAIIADNAAAHFMAQGKIDMVITGADRIARNGDVANKTGTLEKAILAKEFGIPFYVAAPLSTFDADCTTGRQIIIEERSGEEVLFQSGPDEEGAWRKIRVCSPGSAALNPAFDVTPAKYITAIITDRGLIEAEESAILSLLG